MTKPDQRRTSTPALAGERARQVQAQRGRGIIWPRLNWLIACTLLSSCAAPAPTWVPAPPIPVYVPTQAAVRPEPPPADPIALPALLSPPARAVPELTAPQARLAEGIALYERGDFSGALIKLTKSSELAGNRAPAEVRVAALKYAAFSYCVTKRRALCRQQFDALLAIDATYELTAAEARHRAWGPTFRQAKAARATAPAKRK